MDSKRVRSRYESLFYICLEETDLTILAYTILTTVLFLFPPARPVTGSNMNYCIVAFGIIILISGLQWIFDGRKNYTGPRITVDEGVVADELNQDVGSPPKAS